MSRRLSGRRRLDHADDLAQARRRYRLEEPSRRGSSAQAKAPVAPVFFAGQNSRLFQLASHISMTLRLSLLFKEVHDKIGSEVHVRIGDIIPYERLATINDRRSR